jgi:tetratricopeptide (TPR) repeat protein
MDPLPFDPKKIPAALQDGVKSAIKKEDFGTALSSIEDHLAAGGERTGPLLVALAFFEIEYALHVMVDEVLPRSTRALDLLNEAIALGADKKRLSTFKVQCKRIRDGAQAEQDRIEAFLAQEPNQLKVRDITALAYRLLEKGGRSNYEHAAKLWRLAAEKETDHWQKHGHQVNVGLALAEAGNWAEAMPILENAIQVGYDHPEVVWARNGVEPALEALCCYAIEQKDPVLYAATWQRADDWSNRDDDDKLGYHPDASYWQTHLEACLRFKLPQFAQRVLVTMKNVEHGLGRKHPILKDSAKLRELVVQAKKFVESTC